MKRNFSLVLVLFVLFFKCEPDPISGCIDSKALNQDFGADENDGSCRYSDVSFYARHGFYNGIPIIKIDITVNGSEIGATNGTYYPNGPGNCSAPGNVKYTFESGNSLDWNATIYLANGSTLFGSGKVSPRSNTDCIRVDITN